MLGLYLLRLLFGGMFFRGIVGGFYWFLVRIIVILNVKSFVCGIVNGYLLGMFELIGFWIG